MAGREPAGQARGDPGAGVEGRDPGRIEALLEVVEAHGDHDGRVTPAGGGQVLGTEPLEQLAERLSPPDGRRGGLDRLDHLVVGRACRDPGGLGGRVVGLDMLDRLWCRDPGRVGQRLQGLLQHLPVELGDAEAAVAGALVVLPHLQGRLAGGAGLLGLEQGALVGIHCLGTDDRVDATAELLERGGVEVTGQADQVRLGGRPLLGGGGEASAHRQQVQRPADRPSLRQVHPTGRHPRGQDRAVGLQCAGELELRARGRLGLPGLPGDPVRDGAVAGVGDVGVAVGLGQDLEPQRVELRLGDGEVEQGLDLLVGAHRPHRHGAGGEVLEPAAQPGGEVRDRVDGRRQRAVSGAVPDLLAHGSIEPATTDSPGR
nr:hypothetical protein [Nocardioides aequoreus]